MVKNGLNFIRQTTAEYFIFTYRLFKNNSKDACGES